MNNLKFVSVWSSKRVVYNIFEFNVDGQKGSLYLHDGEKFVERIKLKHPNLSIEL